MNAVDQLCPQCGLCCNGVLFGDVELQRGDAAETLVALGIELFKKGRKRAFQQPCACFDGRLCSIYTQRPARCRTFECTQIRQLEAGRSTLAVAEKRVRETKRLVNEVVQLLRRLGNDDESAPLHERYSTVMAQPMDLSKGEDESELRGELMMAVAGLMGILQRDFLAGAK